MAHFIDKKKCIVCGTCELECKFDAIFLDEDVKFAVREEKCRNCGACANICPVDAIEKK
jgi:hydrogenase-4 component H